MAIAASSAEISQHATTQHSSTESAGAVMPFPFLDLKAQFATIREEVMDAVARVMESQIFILGDEVRLFEEETAAMLGAKHAIACASGSDALVLALMAAGVGAGDEVITSPFTFIATGGSIARVGAKPVFVDIDPATFNLSPEKAAAAMGPHTKAIMPVHLFGLAAEMQPLLDLAAERRLPVIEDAAQAIGAKYRGRFAGTIGTFGCFSFFPSKNLGGAGDGGMVTTEDAQLAERLKLLRVHGSRKKYHHEILGTNSRLDAIQAAILRVKLKYLSEWAHGRQMRAARYRKLFEAADLAHFVLSPAEPSADFVHVYNQFTIRCRERDKLIGFLKQAGIPTEIYYPLPLHLQPAFAYLGGGTGQFPETERASAEVLSLPVFPELTNGQQDAVVEAIGAFYAPRGQENVTGAV